MLRKVLGLEVGRLDAGIEWAEWADGHGVGDREPRRRAAAGEKEVRHVFMARSWQEGPGGDSNSTSLARLADGSGQVRLPWPLEGPLIVHWGRSWGSPGLPRETRSLQKAGKMPFLEGTT